MSGKSGLDYDILVVGGGMVGASFACALRNTALKIGIIEAYPFGSLKQPSYDDRSIALAYGSRRIFEGMGLWEALQDHVTPIDKIHVSNRGYFGVTRLDCRENRVEALGYVVENRVLGSVLADSLMRSSNIDLITPAKVVGLNVEASQTTISIARDAERFSLTAPIVVAADGDRSVVRDLLGIERERQDYNQVAIVANVSPEYNHNNVAYERFTDSGPLALLPLSENRCSLVWTVAPKSVEALLALNEDAFLSQLQRCFGFRLGRFRRAGKRGAYPLALVRVPEQVRNRVALIGNAAHTLHPVAGQGFNLGIRDVAALAQVVSEASVAKRDIGSIDVLRDYARWRDQDHKSVITFTDTLARVFTNRLPPIVLGRNLALVSLDVMPALKRTLSRRTMGMAGKLPRLARGLPL